MVSKRKSFPKNPMSVGGAAVYSLGIALLMHFLLVLIFFFGRGTVMPATDIELPPRPQPTSSMIVISFLLNAAFMFVMYLINFAFLKSGLRQPAKTILSIAVSLVTAILLSFLIVKAHIWFIDPDIPQRRMVVANMSRDVVLTVIVIFTSQLIYLYQRKQQMDVENESLKAEYARSKYETLKNQTDPHFLFNTLNTLSAIIKTDPELAQEYVQKLSSVFRYTMQNKGVVRLDEELGFTRDYALLVKMRFGDNLRFEFDTDAGYYDYLVAPLSVQALVENAVKHNVISKTSPLTVTVRTNADQTLTVSNRLAPKKEPEEGGGIGLVNLSERYRLQWQRDITIDNSDGVFRVTIPLIAPNQ